MAISGSLGALPIGTFRDSVGATKDTLPVAIESSAPNGHARQRAHTRLSSFGGLVLTDLSFAAGLFLVANPIRAARFVLQKLRQAPPTLDQ